jgi:hypothetical protein
LSRTVKGNSEQDDEGEKAVAVIHTSEKNRHTHILLESPWRVTINALFLCDLAPKETNIGNLADHAVAFAGVDFCGNDHFGTFNFC